jgi:hypothetical protein
VRSPLVVIRGGRSQLFQPEDAAYLLSLIAPGSPYVEIPEAEHHAMIDQPLAFVAALRACWRPGRRRRRARRSHPRPRALCFLTSHVIDQISALPYDD